MLIPGDEEDNWKARVSECCIARKISEKARAASSK